MCVCVGMYFAPACQIHFFILTFDFHFYSFSTFFSMHLKSALREGGSVLQVLRTVVLQFSGFVFFRLLLFFFFLPLTKCGAKLEKKIK